MCPPENEKYALVSDKNKEGSDDLYIVGIGASAGGLEALEAFFSKVPSNINNVAFVVVLHLSPDYKSLMAQLLSKHTQLQVHNADNGMKVKGNSIYLIPPKKTMTIKEHTLYLHERGPSKMPSFTIDIFFRSLADEQKERAICIVLSGTGSDGTRGIKAIKEVGGLVMVQDVENAKFDGMPKNAIATGLVDYILPAFKMPAELIHYIEHPGNQQDIQVSIGDVEDAFAMVMSIIRKTTNIDFSFYKRDTITRRIQRRMSVNKFTELEKYANHLQQNHHEARVLQRELLIGVTRFFRDNAAFDYLAKEIIPQVFKNATGNTIRVWVAGCSTGEEAYSLAILLYEQAQKEDQHFEIKMFATDLDREAILTAGTGKYPESIVADVSNDRLNKYFIKVGEEYQVARFIRDMIIFTNHDIVKDPPFNKLDLVSCRNLLIYFQASLQRKVLQLFSFSLNKDSFLFLGSSESADSEKKYFESLNTKFKVYKTIGSAKLMDVHDYPLKRVQTQNYTSTKNDYLSNISTRSSEITELNSVLELVAGQYIKTCVLVNSNYEFVRSYGNAKKFLSFPDKSQDINILSVIHPQLSIPLGTTLKNSIEKSEKMQYRDIAVDIDDKTLLINLTVIPFRGSIQKNLYLIIIDEISYDTESRRKIVKYEVDQSAKIRIDDLEQELKFTRENLQATIEELQTSNEELIASNEELQSTNEELQSVNEELYTINSEHQANIIELTELNDDVNNLLQSTEIGTLFLDNELNIRKFNKSVTEQIRITENDIGRSIKDFSINFTYNHFIQDIEAVLASLQPLQREVADNKERWYLMRVLPYRTSENQIRGVVVTFVNINELKEAQRLRAITKNLKIQKEKLVEANKGMEQFAYSASHDLKEPLRSIKSFTQLLKRKEIDNISEDSKEYLEFIIRNAQRMYWLIDGILAFSRIGTDQLKMEYVDSGQAVNVALENLNELIEEKTANINIENLPNVFANDILLAQVFQNLISNAIKFVKENRTPEINISSSTENGIVTFSIEDNGVGISQEFKEIVFTMFKQLEAEQRFEGSGIGLALCKKIIQSFGGNIWFESIVNKGSIFYFSVPEHVYKK